MSRCHLSSRIELFKRVGQEESVKSDGLLLMLQSLILIHFSLSTLHKMLCPQFYFFAQ